MHVPEHDTLHVGEPGQKLQETMRLHQADGIHPAAANGHRGMVGGHQARPTAGSKCGGEPVQLPGSQCAAGLPGQMGVKPDHRPVANSRAAGSNQGVATQAAPQPLRVIVISRQDHHGAIAGGEAVSQQPVGTPCFVLAHVTCNQNQIRGRSVDGCQTLVKLPQAVYAPIDPVGISQQMRIAELCNGWQLLGDGLCRDGGWWSDAVALRMLVSRSMVDRLRAASIVSASCRRRELS